jgi:hypothetical protein
MPRAQGFIDAASAGAGWVGLEPAGAEKNVLSFVVPRFAEMEPVGEHRVDDWRDDARRGCRGRRYAMPAPIC